jgi:UDP-N-acetylmuramyl pentapeptide phosphotransferase/UDP-N-acetylglucosamine-1-phosphate transferase
MVTLALWPLARWSALSGSHVLLLASFTGLACVSWIDDRRGLTPGIRLLIQAIAATLCLASLPAEMRIMPTIPLTAERIIAGIAWLWFVNLYNFMDGIDGLAGGESIAVAAGYLLVMARAGGHDPLWQLALIIAAACAGYLAWNWHPAKVFMGDAGSIPLGFVLGWLMLDLALAGNGAASLILPLYFVADATVTLGKRLLQGKSPWQAHRQHFYQRAVLGGTTPAALVLRIMAVNGVLIGLALLSIAYPILATIGAVAAVAALLVHLEMLARTPVHKPRVIPNSDR